MKAGKREDSLFFIIRTASFCLAATPRSLGTEISPFGFFPRAEDAIVKRDNTKEDVQ
jgi:hypothetical protein